ncbi:hypothetical protein GCM10027294_08610 [Marinactinospora endophytica]
MAMAERLLPGELWVLFQRVWRLRTPCGGRRGHGVHRVLAAAFSVATTGCTRARPPSVSGPVVYRRLTEWIRTRVRAGLHRFVLDGLGAYGEPDWSWYAIGPVNIRALE